MAIEYRQWLLDTHPQMNRVNSVSKYEDVTILLLCLDVRCGPIVGSGTASPVGNWKLRKLHLSFHFFAIHIF